MVITTYIEESAAVALMNETNRKSTLRLYFPLDTLSYMGFSASEQLSVKAATELLVKIPTHNVCIVDLREECHVFCNGFSVSLTNTNNDANRGKSKKQIQAQEAALVRNLQEKGLLESYSREKTKVLVENQQEKRVRFFKQPLAVIDKTSVYTEETFICEILKKSYVRIPVTDHEFPSDTDIDQLVSLYEKQRKEQVWLHFHCAAGKGRSSSFIAMLAILHLAKYLSLGEIFSYLEAGGNIELLKPAQPGEVVKKRADPIFWSRFYEFACSVNTEKTSWSSWVAMVNK